MQNISRAMTARPEKRFLGFVIDYSIITALRFLVFKICMGMFLTDHINTFIRETSKAAGKSFFRSKILKEQATYTIDTSLFIEIAIVVILIILVAPVYNIITTKLTKLKTTLGKKVFAIYPQTSGGQDVGIIRILCHYIFSTFPIIPIATVIGANIFNDVFANIMRQNKELAKVLEIKTINIQVPTYIIALSVVVILIWYGMVFFTKDKLTGHDFICRTKFVSSGSGAKPFNIPFLYDFVRKLLNKVRPFVNKITKK
jgi:uncharacterized RDD family membrane protein YckC